MHILNIAFGDRSPWLVNSCDHLPQEWNEFLVWLSPPQERTKPREHRIEIWELSWLGVTVSGTFHQVFPHGWPPWRISKKKPPAAHGGILEPAPSAGAQHFFTHKTSNSDQIMISLLPGTARATAGRDLVSQARAISSCTALVPAPMGENSLIFSLSAFLLFSFGHFSPFPASPSKVNQAPHEMHLTVPQRHPKMFELTVCLSQENLSYARATKTALTLKTSSVALQGSCLTSSDLWILTWPLWVEGCFKMHTCNNHQVVWDKKSPKNQFIA